jgi:hypothetical protein
MQGNQNEQTRWPLADVLLLAATFAVGGLFVALVFFGGPR